MIITGRRPIGKLLAAWGEELAGRRIAAPPVFIAATVDGSVAGLAPIGKGAN
jgi:hypothetical protein